MPIGSRILFRQKRAPQRGLHFQQFEVIPGHYFAKDSPGFSATRHSHRCECIAGHSGKSRILLRVIQKVWIRDRRCSNESGIGSVDPHESVRMPDRQRTQNQRVDDAEDRSIGPDAESNCEKRNNGKCRIFHEHSQSEFQVGDHRFSFMIQPSRSCTIRLP